MPVRASEDDDDAFQADICACPYRTDLDNRVQLLPKDKIKEKLGYSPDLGDAAALTFAEIVVMHDNSYTQSMVMDTSFNAFG